MPSQTQRELFDAPTLVERLHALGLRGVDRVELHENHSVMVSVTPRGVLRVHRGFAYAPDAVLMAIVQFVRPGLRRDRRAEYRRRIIEFPVHAYVGAAPRRRRRPHVRAEDRQMVAALARRHRMFNERHFDGALADVRFRISDRMRSRLGEVQLGRDGGRVEEIAISRRHVLRDGWTEVDQTLLHEMIHQWQAETGRPVDHGSEFRRKALAIGIEPRASRHIRSPRPREYRYDGFL